MKLATGVQDTQSLWSVLGSNLLQVTKLPVTSYFCKVTVTKLWISLLVTISHTLNDLERQFTALSSAHYSFIDPKKDERLSWPGLLTML